MVLVDVGALVLWAIVVLLAFCFGGLVVWLAVADIKASKAAVARLFLSVGTSILAAIALFAVIISFLARGQFIGSPVTAFGVAQLYLITECAISFIVGLCSFLSGLKALSEDQKEG